MTKAPQEPISTRSPLLLHDRKFHTIPSLHQPCSLSHLQECLGVASQGWSPGRLSPCGFQCSGILQYRLHSSRERNQANGMPKLSWQCHGENSAMRCPRRVFPILKTAGSPAMFNLSRQKAPMKTYTITLTESQLTTLQTFLKRTNLSGAEVPAFMSVVTALKSAKEKQPEPVKQ